MMVYYIPSIAGERWELFWVLALLVVFGVENWKTLTFIWALVSLYNTFNFIRCPIERLIEDGKSMGIRKLLKTPVFWLMIILMVCSGASEATMAQWASAFTESAIGVSQTVGI